MDRTAATPTVIRLADYRPPAFLIPAVDLSFDIRDDATLVTARLTVMRNPAAADPAAPLALDGDELKLESVRLDGKLLSAAEYRVEDARLVIASVPERFTLETVSSLDPAANTKLMGLYASNTGLFTQCEAEGFRRITWFIDRPDVMSRYTTTIRADSGIV